MSVELRHLRALVAVVDALSFSRAAQRLHLTQAGLSRQIAQLERIVGVRLLDRTTRHVELTAAGAAYLEEARQALQHAELATAAARAIDRSHHRLRLDVADAPLSTPRAVVQHLRRTMPEHELVVSQTHSPAVNKRLLDREIDVALNFAFKLPAEVRHCVVRLEPAYVLLPPGDPLTTLSAVPVAALHSRDVLVAPMGLAPAWDAFVYDTLDRAGATARLVPSDMPHAELLPDAVVSMSHVAVVHESVALSATDEVAVRPLVDPVPLIEWAVLWLRSTHVDDVIQQIKGLAGSRGWLNPRQAS